MEELRFYGIDFDARRPCSISIDFICPRDSSISFMAGELRESQEGNLEIDVGV